jgi:hypothetical protein
MRLLIDTTGLTFTSGGVAQAETQYGTTDVPRTDRDGRQIYRLAVLVVGPDGFGEVLAVKVAGEPKAIVPQIPLKVSGLAVVPYEVNGHKGVSYWAASIEPARAERASS